jgi:hemoglobin-like flavoprotein
LAPAISYVTDLPLLRLSNKAQKERRQAQWTGILDLTLTDQARDPNYFTTHSGITIYTGASRRRAFKTYNKYEYFMQADHCKSLILRSFESTRLNLDTFIHEFYRTFFLLCPESRAIFPSDTARLEAKMLASLTHIAETLEDTDRLNAILSQLGEKHRRMQISDTHFRSFIDSFISALASTLGPDWSDEMHEAWSDFLAYIAKRMAFFPPLEQS